MTFRRALKTRFIASVAIALSTQIAAAQALNCMQMSARHESADHSAMLHHVDANGLNAASGASHTDNPASASCSQTMLCANAPAMPIVTLRVGPIGQWTFPIAFFGHWFEARAPRPESPPPKI